MTKSENVARSKTQEDRDVRLGGVLLLLLLRLRGRGGTGGGWKVGVVAKGALLEVGVVVEVDAV